MKKTRINTGTWPCGYNRHRIVRSAFCKEWLFSTNPRVRTSPRNMSIDMVIWKFQQGDNLASRIILNEVPYAIIIRMINLQLLTISMCIWFFFISHILANWISNDFLSKIDCDRYRATFVSKFTLQYRVIACKDYRHFEYLA